MHLREKAKHVIAILTMLQSLKKEGFVQIQNIFLETANQEKRTCQKINEINE